MGNREKRLVHVISLLTAVCLIGDSFLYIVLPIYWREVGLSSLFQAGILLAVNRFVRLPLNPFVTWLYQKISIRTGIFIAVVLAGVTTASYGLLNGFWLWFVARCIWGFTWTLLRLGAYFAIVTISDHDSHGRYMGTYNGLFRLGSLVGMLLGGVLTEVFGLKLVALFLAVPAFLCIPFVFRFIANVQLAGITSKSSTISMAFSMLKENKLLLALISGMFISLFFSGVLASTLSHVIYSHLSAQTVLLGITVGSVSLAGLLQAMRWGWEPFLAPWFGKISDRRNRRQPFFIGALLLAAIFAAAIPGNLSVEWWLCMIIGLQVTATMLTTLIDALAAEAAPVPSKILFMSVYSIMLDLGAAIGPILGYIIGEKVVFQGAAIVFLLLSISWLISSLKRLMAGQITRL